MKNILMCLVLVVSILCGVAHAAPDLKKGLVLHYDFDQNQGGSVTDKSGKGHQGIVYGAAYSADGRFGGGYHFDGQDDYISAGNLGFHAVGTISFWMNADTVENWRNPFSTDYAGWDDCIRFEESTSGVFSGGGHGLGRGGNFTESLVPHRWYHLVYMWDEGYAYGFLDGVLKFKNPHPDPNSKVHPDLPLTAGEYKNITLNFFNVAIGNGYSTDPERFWKGMMDDVRVYDRPLSMDEVVKLYENKDDGLVLHYTFDDAPLNGKIMDESGQGNNGVVNGGVTFRPGEGKGRGAFEFHGNESIFVGKDDSLNVGKQLTFTAWYKATNQEQDPILEYSNGLQAGAHLWINTIGSQWNNKGTGANLVDTTNNDVSYVISTENQSLNQWHHLAVSYDGITGTGRVYIDGILAETRILGIFTPQTSYDLYIGRRPWDHQAFTGLLDEIRIYNRPLTDREVRALYDSTGLGLIYQNFEVGNGTPSGNPAGQPEYGWGINGATWALSKTIKHSGNRSWELTCVLPGGTGIPSQIETYDLDAEPERHDRLTFWILGKPADNLDHEVRVRFFDTNYYFNNGFEVYTTRKFKYNQWTQLTVLFTQLPADFDLKHINKINFWIEASGKFYFDDIQIESQDRFYQDFEPWSCPAASPADCQSNTWNGSGEVVTNQSYSGKQSFKLIGTNYWNGGGIKSQEKRCVPPETCTYQSEWNVDLNPQHLKPTQSDRLTFWMSQYGSNGMANNVEVKFFDHGQYRHFATEGARVWTKKNGEYGGWARMSVPLNELPSDLNLTDLDLIEMSLYWPGTYYFDDIRASKGAEIKIDPAYLSSGIVKWNRAIGAAKYTLQESSSGPTGLWKTIYPVSPDPGTETVFINQRLKSSWLKVRWETPIDSKRFVSYPSDWSDTVLYQPRPVLLKNDILQNQGIIDWTFIPQATQYEVQEGDTRNGPWTTPSLYTGGYRIEPLTATFGKWYRVRGLRTNTAGTVIEYGPWSPALLYNPNAYLRVVGTRIKEKNGTGSEIKLRGVNLGNFFLLETWMLGSGKPYEAKFPDDWTIREKLGTNASALLETYQQAYLKDMDFDNIVNTGSNFIRLPIHYKNIRDIDDTTGQWLPGTGYDFATIDRIINLSADRGLYVLLDLHGAPGGQNDYFHSGRTGYNKLFANDPLGAEYRARTRELWRAIVQRYRNNTTVMGFDILNEPVGVYAYSPDPSPLWNFYNEVYHDIRDTDKGADGNHIIMMEGVWDWDTLPTPAARGWQNVVYQFHLYCQPPLEGQEPVLGETCPTVNPTPSGSDPVVLPETHLVYQKAFIDAKIASSRESTYRVPTMIGEFNGYGQKAVWEYYLQKFNGKGYHWAMWSYKTHDYPSSYGLYNHSLYDESLPDFDTDTREDLERKFSKYDTLIHHTANQSLINILKQYTPNRSLVK